MADTGRTGRDIGRACFGAGHANAAGPKTCWECVGAAVESARIEAFREAARAVCRWCDTDGPPKQSPKRCIELWHGIAYCRAASIYWRCPEAAVPAEKGEE